MGDGAARGVQQTQIGIGDFGQDWRIEVTPDVGFDEIRETVVEPVAAGERVQIGFVLNGLGWIVFVEPCEVAVEGAMVLERVGVEVLHRGIGIGFVVVV